MEMGSPLEKAMQIIDKKQDGVDFVGPRDEILIKKAEAVLNLEIPQAYRLFIRRYGVASFWGGEIYGIIDDNFTTPGPDAVWFTVQQRTAANMPHNLLVLCDVGDGTYYVLDASNPPAGGGVYVWVPWDPQPADKLEKVAENFADFLLERIEFYRYLE